MKALEACFAAIYSPELLDAATAVTISSAHKFNVQGGGQCG